ncbi:MAG: cell division FtsA domain-containing protein, partial [Deltaproteobacteria bacterium]
VVKAVERAGIDVRGVHAASLAAAESVLSREEKERGVVLVDIGDTLTGIAVFKEGAARSLRVLSFGGRNLAEIIANYCHVTMDVAEGIVRDSLEFDATLPVSDELMIRAEGMFRPLPKKELADVVVTEIDKFAVLARDAVVESASACPGMSVVATGGLSLVEGLLEKLEGDLALSVRLGAPRGMAHIPVSVSVACAAAAGMLFETLPSGDGQPLLLQESRNKVARLVESLRHLYQDYF